MVIVIEGTPLLKCPKSTDEFYNRYPSLVERGLSFVHENARQVQPEFTLYVAQGEFGVVPGKDSKVKIIGSDDATTCHIVILRHPSGTVGVAHFDGSKNEEAAISAMVEKITNIERGAEGLQLCVVGGYTPEIGSHEASRNEAEHLSLKILGMFSRHSCSFHLSLWCTCRLNTVQGSSGPQPIIYGVGVDILTGSIFPACFKSHDPNIPLRSASRWISGDKKLYDIYDYHSGTITIDPFYYSGMDCFSFYKQLSDDLLLRNFSTSPKVEPPRFCQDLRKVFQVFVDHPNPEATLFLGKKSKKYVMNSNGLWELMQEQL
ncbi:protein N-terminal asparagine amidohydrolase-like isoform X1 [Homarus americanus]|uniref:protein N-terminal asparagine amidohydrolase-like isoform X1 n=1 Tax=Homarus americanus TaxID=6706 RepID=UPI001C4639E0|nr:protein N-terminal asparagine amidohydrolase-like isoform X1 [Homarus americanus]